MCVYDKIKHEIKYTFYLELINNLFAVLSRLLLVESVIMYI